jgi:hypothetical protein
MESVQTLSMLGPTVRIILGLCMDLALTQLGHGWLVKQNIHQSSVLAQSTQSLCRLGGGV